MKQQKDKSPLLALNAAKNASDTQTLSYVQLDIEKETPELSPFMDCINDSPDYRKYTKKPSFFNPFQIGEKRRVSWVSTPRVFMVINLLVFSKFNFILFSMLFSPGYFDEKFFLFNVNKKKITRVRNCLDLSEVSGFCWSFQIFGLFSFSPERFWNFFFPFYFFQYLTWKKKIYFQKKNFQLKEIKPKPRKWRLSRDSWNFQKNISLFTIHKVRIKENLWDKVWHKIWKSNDYSRHFLELKKNFRETQKSSENCS